MRKPSWAAPLLLLPDISQSPLTVNKRVYLYEICPSLLTVNQHVYLYEISLVLGLGQGLNGDAFFSFIIFCPLLQLPHGV